MNTPVPRRQRKFSAAKPTYDVMQGPPLKSVQPSMTKKQMLRPQLGLGLGMDRRAP